MSDVYKKQIGGDHYQSMEIQPSEFINKNNLPFAEGNAINICADTNRKDKSKIWKKQFTTVKWQLIEITLKIF